MKLQAHRGGCPAIGFGCTFGRARRGPWQCLAALGYSWPLVVPRPDGHQQHALAGLVEILRAADATPPFAPPGDAAAVGARRAPLSTRLAAVLTPAGGRLRAQRGEGGAAEETRLGSLSTTARPALLEHLYDAIGAGPTINCWPHNSQRVELQRIAQFLPLVGEPGATRLGQLLSASAAVRVAARAQLPRLDPGDLLKGHR